MGVDAMMFFAVKGELTDEQVLVESREMAEAIDPKFFWISDGTGYAGDKPRHALFKYKAEDGEGWIVNPPAGYTVLQVSMMLRYYGPGYERGPWSILGAMIRYARHRWTGCKVYYGGDSDGAIKEFNSVAEDYYWDHFAKHGGRPYRYSFDDNPWSTPTMKRTCPHDKIPMFRYGWGGGDAYAAFRCGGCGRDEITKDGGKTWTLQKKEP